LVEAFDHHGAVTGAQIHSAAWRLVGQASKKHPSRAKSGAHRPSGAQFEGLGDAPRGAGLDGVVGHRAGAIDRRPHLAVAPFGTAEGGVMGHPPFVLVGVLMQLGDVWLVQRASGGGEHVVVVVFVAQMGFGQVRQRRFDGGPARLTAAVAVEGVLEPFGGAGHHPVLIAVVVMVGLGAERLGDGRLKQLADAGHG
jgi:hypothetical protein